MLALGVMVPVLPKLIVAFEQGNIAEAAGVAGIRLFQDQNAFTVVTALRSQFAVV